MLQRRLEDYVDDEDLRLFPELPVPLTLLGVILEHVPRLQTLFAVLAMSLWRSCPDFFLLLCYHVFALLYEAVGNSASPAVRCYTPRPICAGPA